MLEVKEGLGVYSEATCVEFHRLLVAELRAYKTALHKFRETHRTWTKVKDKSGKMNSEGSKGMCQNHGCKGLVDETKEQGGLSMWQGVGKQGPTDPKPMSSTSSGDAYGLAELQKALVERAQLLWQCAYLLWCIAYSQMFLCHLAMLQCGRWLHLPDKNDVGQLANWVPFSARLTVQHDKGGQDGGYEVDQEADQEFQCMHEAYRNGHSVQSIYLWWTRLQVSYWEAVNIFSTFGHEVATPVKNIKVNLLAEKCLGHSGGEMDPWETVVMNLVDRAAQASPQSQTDTNLSDIPLSRTRKQIRPFDGQAAVALLKKKIHEYALGKGYHPIFLAFQPSEYSEDKSTSYIANFHGRMHCEAVLSSLIKCYADNVCDANTGVGVLLKQHVKVMSCLRDRGLR